MDRYSFQVCQKIVVLDRDRQRVLLVRRTGEADLDGVFSLIGGKLETDDASILEGLRREKVQEVGPDAKLRIMVHRGCYCLLFRKRDGSMMYLPYYAAIYDGGDIALNPKEYSELQWVSIQDLAAFEPKAEGIVEAVQNAVRQLENAVSADFALI